METSAWNDCFVTVYRLCEAFPHSLYKRLYGEVETLLEDHVKVLSWKLKVTSDECFLGVYYQHWQKYGKGAIKMNNLFQHLNRKIANSLKNDIGNKDEMKQISALAFGIWKRQMIIPYESRLSKLLLQEIQHDREGATANNTICHGVVHSLVEILKFEVREALTAKPKNSLAVNATKCKTNEHKQL